MEENKLLMVSREINGILVNKYQVKDASLDDHMRQGEIARDNI